MIFGGAQDYRDPFDEDTANAIPASSAQNRLLIQLARQAGLLPDLACLRITKFDSISPASPTSARFG